MEDNTPSLKITVTYNQHLQCWTATDDQNGIIAFGENDIEAFQNYLKNN